MLRYIARKVVMEIYLRSSGKKSILHERNVFDTQCTLNPRYSSSGRLKLESFYQNHIFILAIGQQMEAYPLLQSP